MMSSDLSLEVKGKQRSNGASVLPTKFYSIKSVYHERLHADDVLNKHWLVRSFSSQHYSEFLPTLPPKCDPSPY